MIVRPGFPGYWYVIGASWFISCAASLNGIFRGSSISSTTRRSIPLAGRHFSTKSGRVSAAPTASSMPSTRTGGHRPGCPVRLRPRLRCILHGALLEPEPLPAVGAHPADRQSTACNQRSRDRTPAPNGVLQRLDGAAGNTGRPSGSTVVLRRQPGCRPGCRAACVGLRPQPHEIRPSVQLLIPHITRALEINRVVVANQRAEAMLGTALDTLGAAAILIAGSGRVVLANKRGEDFMRSERVLSVDRYGGVYASRPRDDRALRRRCRLCQVAHTHVAGGAPRVSGFGTVIHRMGFAGSRGAGHERRRCTQRHRPGCPVAHRADRQRRNRAGRSDSRGVWPICCRGPAGQRAVRGNDPRPVCLGHGAVAQHGAQSARRSIREDGHQQADGASGVARRCVGAGRATAQLALPARSGVQVEPRQQPAEQADELRTPMHAELGHGGSEVIARGREADAELLGGFAHAGTAADPQHDDGLPMRQTD